jgi:hypothetical protein
VRVHAKRAAVAHFTLVALRPGDHPLLVRANAGQMVDAVERRVRVEPDGTRIQRTHSGHLRSRRISHELVQPKHAIAGASKLWVKIYPGTFGQLVDANALAFGVGVPSVGVP